MLFRDCTQKYTRSDNTCLCPYFYRLHHSSLNSEFTLLFILLADSSALQHYTCCHVSRKYSRAHAVTCGLEACKRTYGLHDCISRLYGTDYICLHIWHKIRIDSTNTKCEHTINRHIRYPDDAVLTSNSDDNLQRRLSKFLTTKYNRINRQDQVNSNFKWSHSM